MKIGAKEYDLVLQNDTNSKGNTQWFFFSVSNTKKNQIVRFNIVNLMKNDSLFNYGMKPVICSKKKYESEQLGWQRGGFNVSYFKNQIQRESQEKKTYYTLQFCYKFENAKDTVSFAHCYPYTYSDLNTYLFSIMNQNEINKICSRKQLCLSLAKNKCDILTITAPHKNKPEPNQKPKQVVLIMARQHSGETPSSWMVEGIINFLVNQKDEEASYLREKCIFKIIPMVNPDGVIHGNYRTDLSGVDLNRNWFSPSRDYLTTVYAIKQLISQISKEYRIRYIIDLHGHSKKMNAFFYGNPNEEDIEESRILPLTCSQETKYIDFSNCTFRLEPSKTTTARISLYNQLFKSQKTNILTLEASFYGWISKNQEKNHFTIDQFKEIGASVCKSMYKLYKQEEEYELEIQRHIQTQQQKIDEENRDNPQSEKRQVIDVQIYKSMNVYERLFKNFKCDVQSLIKKSIIKSSLKSKEESSGSDSDPLADELTVKEIKSISLTIVQPKILSADNKNKNSIQAQKQPQPSSNQKSKQNVQNKTQSENSSPKILNQFILKKNFEEDQIKTNKETKSQNSTSRNISKAIQTDFQEWLSRQNSLQQLNAKQQEDEDTIDIVDVQEYSKNGQQNMSNYSQPNSTHSYYQQNQMRGSSLVQSCYKKQVKQYQEFVTNSHSQRQGSAKYEVPQYRKNSYWQQAYNSKAQKLLQLNNEMNSTTYNQIMVQNSQNQSNNFEQIKLNNEILFQNNINNQNYKSISNSPMKNNYNNYENSSPYYYGINSNQIENVKNDDPYYQNDSVKQPLNQSMLKQSKLQKADFRSPHEESQNFVVQISKNTYKMANQGQTSLKNNGVNKNNIGPNATQLQFFVRSDLKKFKGAYYNRNQYSRQNELSTSQILEDAEQKQNFKSQKIVVQDVSTQTLITLQTISRLQKSAPIKQFIQNENQIDHLSHMQQNNNKFNQNLRNSVQKTNKFEKKQNQIIKKKSESLEQLQDQTESINDNCKVIEKKSSFNEMNEPQENQLNSYAQISNPSGNKETYKNRQNNVIYNRSLLTYKQYISQTQHPSPSPEEKMKLLYSDIQPLNIQLNKNSITSIEINQHSINYSNNNQNTSLSNSQNNQDQQNQKLVNMQDNQQNQQYQDIHSIQQTNKLQEDEETTKLINQNRRDSENKSIQCVSNPQISNGQSMTNSVTNNKNYAVNNIVQLINTEQQFQNKLNFKQNAQNNVFLNKTKLMQMINSQFSQNTSINSSNTLGYEMNIQGVNVKANQNKNSQQVGIVQNKNITIHQKQQLMPIDMDINKKDQKNLHQKNTYKSNNSQKIQNLSQQNNNQNKETLQLNNKINRASRNGRSTSMNHEYLVEQQQQNSNKEQDFNQTKMHPYQNQNDNYKYEITSSRKDVSRKNSILNKNQNNIIEISVSNQNDNLTSDRQNRLKINNLQQQQNTTFDSYYVPTSQTDNRVHQNIQIEQSQISTKDLNQSIISAQNGNPSLNVINLESNEKYQKEVDVLDFIKQQKAILKNNNQQNTTLNNSNNGTNASMRIAYVQRQARKIYNSPFNQRFLEKIIN